MWDPSRISERALGKPRTLISLEGYLKNMEQCWPYEAFYFQEELALYYLMLKNYDLDRAVTSALFNRDELIKLILGK